MKLTTRGRYAVTAMLDVALHQQRAPVRLADVAARQDISIAYLEQLFAGLRRGGLVESVRGPRGGYRLARRVHEISVADIIASVDETIDATRCGGGGDCQDGEQCLTHDLWTDLSRQIATFLAGVSLADVLARRQTQSVARRQDARGGRRIEARML
jgi:Rrf2 family iron-sulfur cluster assembly transcriptional regulator